MFSNIDSMKWNNQTNPPTVIGEVDGGASEDRFKAGEVFDYIVF